MYLVERGHLDGSGTLPCHMNGHFFEPDHLFTHAVPFGPLQPLGRIKPSYRALPGTLGKGHMSCLRRRQ